jgi:hypothetical protein
MSELVGSLRGGLSSSTICTASFDMTNDEVVFIRMTLKTIAPGPSCRFLDHLHTFDINRRQGGSPALELMTNLFAHGCWVEENMAWGWQADLVIVLWSHTIAHDFRDN